LLRSVTVHCYQELCWQLSPQVAQLHVLHYIPVKKLPAYYGTVHNSQPLVPIVSHMNPVHTLPSYFFTLHFNIIRYAQSQRSFLQQLHCKRMSWR